MKEVKPKVLVVGTFHFGGSPDMVQIDAGNMLAVNKQKEVLEVVEKLENYKPTKVAVEVEKEKEVALNQRYEEYIDNNFELTSNEVHQLGFRICELRNHQKIFAIDWMGNIGSRSIGEVLEWAETNQTKLYDLITKVYIPKIKPKINGLSILEAIKSVNQKERIQIDHELYLNIAQIGEGMDYVGIDWVKWWYQRNLIIYNNIIKLIENADERILLLIGSAHIHLVSQFLTESGQVEVENIEDYL
ncbi:DUF5694 domain-containing protein [Alteribacter populi]|uniref:DUF5694 domain-containing protein n=1 Tax=Alteribacter populi TaxID=2011011 RepID=UPI000BBA4E1B|nr:DUF5694 domain-containing protein [Alteribacter populi]